MPPPGVEYRPIAPHEYHEATRLFFESLTALTARHNAPPPPAELVAEEEAGYRFVDETGIFRVATLEGRMVALACAIVRDDEWFLSGFWVDPSVQQRGIGGPLLRQVWDEGLRRGVRRQFVWSSPDPTAIATYMKLGMLPGSQLFAFNGVPHLDVDQDLETGALSIEAASTIDRVIRGVPRAVDHEWWQGQAGILARTVAKRGKLVGYYYIENGRIGAAAWLHPEDGPAVLSHAMRDAAAIAAEVKLVIPGMNHTALRVALRSGLRLRLTVHLLWTEPIGRMEQYIPSGPLLF